MLVVCLLQDGAEEVRDDMASSVGTILSSLAPVVSMLYWELDTQHIHSSYVTGIPHNIDFLLMHTQSCAC